MHKPIRVAFYALAGLLTMARVGANVADAARHRHRAVCGRQFTDTAARILSAEMSDQLGQQVIIENVGGAAGMTGTIRVARSAADGYQLLFGTVDTIAIAPPWRRCCPTTDQLFHSGRRWEEPIVLIVRKDLPVSSLQEFAAYAKANDTKMQLGSAGVGWDRISLAQS